jgi:hypothetical protein
LILKQSNGDLIMGIKPFSIGDHRGFELSEQATNYGAQDGNVIDSSRAERI